MARIIGNTTTTPTPRSDWNQNDQTKADYIKNKPEVVLYGKQELTEEQKARVRSNIGAFSGNYNDLKNVPSTFTPSKHEHDYIPVSEKGVKNGVAELDEYGKVVASQLPTYISDVLEYDSKDKFPEKGESNVVYVDVSTNITYRWGGTIYVAIGSDLALGETSLTAYYGDKGAAAYSHSQITSGNPHNVKAEDLRLAAIATSGDYKDLTNAPVKLSDFENDIVPDVDSELSDTSTNPVQNKIVHEALISKATKDELSTVYQSILDSLSAIEAKLNQLMGGEA